MDISINKRKLWGDRRMRQLFLATVLLTAVPVFASEPVAESQFHLLTTRCEAEANDGIEATPQSPPLEVDDPSTPGCNRWEINILVGGDISRSQTTWDLPLLDINYGIGDNLQLKYELPFVNNVSDDVSASAIGESRAGIKYMFFEDERSETQFAVYPQASFVQSNADVVKKGLASPGSIFTLPVLMSTRIGQTALGKVDLTANLAFNASTKSDTANYLSASVGVGTPIFNRAALMGELATEQALARVSDESRAQLLRADLGVMTPISKQFLLFGSIGHSLIHTDTLGHAYALAGFRLLTGGASPQPDRVAAQ